LVEGDWLVCRLVATAVGARPDGAIGAPGGKFAPTGADPLFEAGWRRLTTMICSI
jgi:hypothetical protein